MFSLNALQTFDTNYYNTSTLNNNVNNNNNNGMENDAIIQIVILDMYFVLYCSLKISSK